MARTTSDVQSWFGRPAAPEHLEASPRGTVALAGELKIENVRYAVATPRLVIVADTLRVGANGAIDVSGRFSRSPGGKIVVIARTLVCESGGRLQLVSNGGADSGSGGSILVIAGTTQLAEGSVSARTLPGDRRRGTEFGGRGATLAPRGGRYGGVGAQGSLPPCISGSVAGGPGASRQVTVRDHRGGKVVTSTRTMTDPPGNPGQISTSQLQPAIQADPDLHAAWSLWVVEWLETLQAEIYDAHRALDYPRVLRLFGQYAAFDAAPTLVDADRRAAYGEVLEQLNAYRRDALPPLLGRELTVLPGGLPQPVFVFTEGATLRTTLAPTHALAARTNVAGRSVLGMIEYVNERPDELSIEVEWELSVDPWSERLATEQLAKGGQRLDGVFAGWSLEAKPMEELGVRSANATLLAGGRRLRVRFVVDAARANLVFWRLLNSAGFPWSVGWTFREPGTGRVATGTWAGPALTLARQRQPSISVTENGIVNTGSSSVTINYVQRQDGAFVALDPTLRIKPGETAAIPAAASSTGTITIPPAAVETAFDPERFASDFYVINGEQVVDRVTVRNNLPSTDPLRGSFDRLEITVRASIDEDGTTPAVEAGPFVLSAKDTKAGQLSIPFLRLARGTRRITVEGKAYYAHDGERTGSERTLKPTTFDTLAIVISEDMFKDYR
jgi:hypothetical protein